MPMNTNHVRRILSDVLLFLLNNKSADKKKDMAIPDMNSMGEQS
jgi:hypothetical protein